MEKILNIIYIYTYIYIYMTTEPDTKNEVGNDNINEEATEPPPETKIEAIPERTY